MIQNQPQGPKAADRTAVDWAFSPAALIFHRDKCQDLMGCEICCKPTHTDRKIH
jgi:hypothetical protein